MKLVGRVITNALPAISHIGTARHKQALRTGRLHPLGYTPDIHFLEGESTRVLPEGLCQ